MALFIVSTPIGNLEDITIRALQVLQSASLILSENTKTTYLLLKKHGIEGKKIVNYTDHTIEAEFLPFLELARTSCVCLVSEAGTPVISDPGYLLVQKAHDLKVPVISIPGACSLICAIANSGIPSFNFAFFGFYSKPLIPKINDALNMQITVSVFVPARDICKTLNELMQNCKLGTVSVSREITKMFEETKTGNAEDVLNYFSTPEKQKGEAVLVISPLQKKVEVSLEDEIKNIMLKKPFLQNLPIKVTTEVISCYEKSLEDFSKKQIYNHLLKCYKTF